MWRALSLACPCETRQLRAVAGIVCNAKRSRARSDTRRRKVHVDIAMRAGGQGAGTVVGLCKVGGVRSANRSEERRVGAECRSRRSPYHYEKHRAHRVIARG